MDRTESSHNGYESLGQETSTPGTNSYENINMSAYPSNTKAVQEDSSRPYLPSDEPTAARPHHVFRFWPWEIGSLFVAFGLIAATYSILSHFNGQRVPEWPFGINLNTLIALISTIMRAAMLVGVAEVISQMKWTWFSRPRPLRHLQYFDAASRSVSGSLTLLFVAPGSVLAVLGALITILSLGIGPFTQQTIRMVNCVREHSEVNASLPVAQFMPANGTYYRIGAGSYELEADMKGTMVNGIVNPTGNDTAIIPVCPTGNCTFTSHNGITHSSLGLCNSCIDTTSLVDGPSGESDNYTLPNDLWVSAISDAAYINIGSDNLTWASSAFTPEFKSISDAAIFNVTVLALTTATCSKDGGNLKCPIADSLGGPTGFVATSCSLYPCLKNYDATMEKGTLSEKIVSTRPATINWREAQASPGVINAYMNWTALQTPCFLDDTWWDLSNISDVPKKQGRLFTDMNIEGVNYTAPNDCLYKMMFPYMYAMSTFMGSDLLTGQCTYNSRQGQAVLCGDKWWLSSLYRNKEASFDTLRTAFDQFSTAITNKFRTTGSSIYDWNVREKVEGMVYETTVCIEFQWKWLLMPTFLVAATGAILIAIIIRNLRDERQPVWKSSLLPLLYHGFGHQSQYQDPNGAAMDLAELNQAASSTRAKFQNTGGAGFVDVTPRLDDLIRRRGRDVDVDSLIEGR